MRKTLSILLVFLVVIILIEIIYYMSVSSKKTPPSTPTPTTNYVASLSPTPTLHIIYQKSGDSEGRTVVYESEENWGGIGKQQKYPWTYIVGSFDRWEEIPGSKDRYLHLTNPMTGEEIAKIKILFGKKEVFPEKELTTYLDVENLEKLGSGDLEFERLGEVATIPNNTLDQYLKKGDAVVVYLMTKGMFTDDANDVYEEIVEQDAPLAYVLAIRRYEEITNN